MTKDITSGGFRIRKGDKFVISMFHLSKNAKEWIDPDRFAPERFDPKSPLFLTPSGKKRNPFSFSPFLGGTRICIGKTFVETISKVITPSILSKFKFEHISQEARDAPNPKNNMLCLRTPQLVLRMSIRK